MTFQSAMYLYMSDTREWDLLSETKQKKTKQSPPPIYPSPIPSVIFIFLYGTLFSMNINALRTFPISIEIQWGMHKYRIHSIGALYFAEVYVKIQEVSAVPELLLKQMDSQAATFTFHLVRFPGSCRCLCSHIDAWWYCQCIGGDPVGPWCLLVYIKHKRQKDYLWAWEQRE